MSYSGAYPLWDYGWMMGDQVRNQAYYRALQNVITPDTVVADIGAGAGLFSLMACQLGARKVYAIEPSPAVWLAGELAQKNGFGDRVECFQALSTEINLPEKVDVVVSDLRSFLPYHLGHLAAIADIKERLLKPGGVLIPERDRVYASVVQAEKVYRRCVSPWGDSNVGLDFSAMGSKLANTFHKLHPRDSVVKLSPSHQLTSLEYLGDCPVNLQANLSSSIETSGTGHGLMLWFDSYLGESAFFSNDLDSPELIYGAAFLPWETPLVVSEGDTLELGVGANLVGDHYVWSWKVSTSYPENNIALNQSTFFGSLLSPAKSQAGKSTSSKSPPRKPS